MNLPDEFHTNVQASTRWSAPQRRIYVYADGTSEIFRDVISLKVTRTGCHVMQLQNSERVYVVTPGWRYIVQDQE